MRRFFVKYTGCGNDFILFDNRENQMASLDPLSIEKLCDRRYGIGADGIILLENSENFDYRMRIYNPDGTEAEMCGNGIRCLAKFIQKLGIEKNPLVIETLCSHYKISYNDHLVAVEMKLSQDVLWNQQMLIDEEKHEYHFLDTGVPHSVLFVPELSNHLCELGPKIRYHQAFHPRGTNVTFAAVQHPSVIKVSTYERGVEQETLACGTGATAAALAAARQFQFSSPIEIVPPSGELMRIFFEKNEEEFSQIYLEGPAHEVFEGYVQIHLK